MSEDQEQNDASQGMNATILGTVLGSRAFNELLEREYSIGANQLLDEILDRKVWSNAEMIWVLRQLMNYYGGNDSLLKKAPVERIFLNLADIVRALYMFLDHSNPELDDNMRSYMSAKMGDATWGITDKTRIYLEKMR